MAANYPGPYELRLKYTVTAVPGGEQQHVQKFSLRLDSDPAPGTGFANIDVLCADNTTRTLSSVTLAWAALWASLYKTTDATLYTAELWKYTPETFLATYVSAMTVGQAGLSAVATVPASNVIITLRTTEGGIMRVSFLDTIIPVAEPLRYGDLSGDTLAMANFLFDAVNRPFLGRDTSFPFVFLGFYPGQNERLFKRRYR
jgi:hypothetical protein